MIVLLIGLIAFGQYDNTFYWSPGLGDPLEDGTVDHPYDSETDFLTWGSEGYIIPNSTAIYLAAGTAYVMTTPSGYGFDFRNDSILFTAFGEGGRPILYTTGRSVPFFNITNKGSDNIIIRGINITKEVSAKYSGAAIGHYGTTDGFHCENIQIIDNEITGFSTAFYFDNGYYNESRVMKDLSFIGNIVHDIGLDGMFLKQYSKFENTGLLHIGGNVFYDINKNWSADDRCEKEVGGDILQILCFDDAIIENNIFDREGTSYKMVVLWSLDPKYHRDGLGLAAVQRDLVFRYNTVYPGFRLEDGWDPCGDGVNLGSHSAFQIYHTDTLWFYSNKVDATRWDYGEFEGKQELHPGLFSRMDARHTFMYDNLFLGCTEWNALSVSDWKLNGGSTIEFINNTTMTHMDGDSYPYYFLLQDQVTTLINNVTIGTTDLTLWVGGTMLDEKNNTDLQYGSGLGYGDTAYFNTQLGLSHIADFNLKPDVGSVLIDDGYAYTFNWTNWWDSIPHARFDVDSVSRPQNIIYDQGAQEYASEQAGDPPGVLESIWYTNLTDTSVTANWAAVSTATGYEIYAMTISELPTYVISPLLDVGNVTHYDIEGFLPNEYCAVGGNAYNENGDGAGTSQDFTTLCQVPEITDFVAADVTLVTGASTNFNPEFVSNSCNETSTFLWTFEGGTPATSTDSVPGEIVYSNAGVYDVSLTIDNNNGGDELIKLNYITVASAVSIPVANFTANSTVTRIGLAVSFTDQSTNTPTSWLWAFSPATVVYMGGTSSASQNPIVRFTAAGSYQVTLTATNSAGSDVEIKAGYITVNTGRLRKWLFLWR